MADRFLNPVVFAGVGLVRGRDWRIPHGCITAVVFSCIFLKKKEKIIDKSTERGVVMAKKVEAKAAAKAPAAKKAAKKPAKAVAKTKK
jgi:uncharacterized ion transporter superfamily protein YfcC